MEYLFFLNGFAAHEPIGWQDFELSLKRDDKTHGIQFEASTGTLRFYGTSAQYLIDQKNLYGIKANVIFTAQEFCNDPYVPFEEISGRLNFGKFKSACGTQCTVEVPLEEQGCKVVFKNRYDHKVDLDLQTASDGLTPLPDYAALDIRLTMPTKALQAAVDGSVDPEEENIVQFNETLVASLEHIYVRPTYALQRYNSIQTGQLVPVSNWDSTSSPDFPISPQVLFEDIITCFNGDFNYSARQKGNLNIILASDDLFTRIQQVRRQLIKWDATGDLLTNGIVVDEQILFTGNQLLPFSLDFDSQIAGTTTLEEGVAIYDVLRIAGAQTAPNQITVTVTYDPETYFTFEAVKTCPATTADAYLIHETVSRIAESITNGCVRAKSSYYGRTDSQPFAFDADGCGGLRMLTSGLKIRNAPDGKFFASMKDVFEGLNAIDNIGFDLVEDENVPSHFIMRVEAVDFFYQNEEVFVIDNIPQAEALVQEQLHFSKVNVGYKKWEVEGVNGLDEFNSTREYRTSLDTVSGALDITSQLVAGGYPYEITRQQNFADTGAADTKFDNDIFILTLLRTAYAFEVEQGNVTNASGFFDPATIINARLSPLRNLMRWYKTIAAGYVPLSDSENNLAFNAGTGNFIAAMEILEGAYDAQCKIESATIAENQSLFVTHFAHPQDYTPLWKNEIQTFEYPLNIAEYKAIKAAPYGYISYRCGSAGDFEKGFIKEIKFKPARGLANFSLLKKWE